MHTIRIQPHPDRGPPTTAVLRALDTVTNMLAPFHKSRFQAALLYPAGGKRLTDFLRCPQEIGNLMQHLPLAGIKPDRARVALHQQRHMKPASQPATEPYTGRLSLVPCPCTSRRACIRLAQQKQACIIFCLGNLPIFRPRSLAGGIAFSKIPPASPSRSLPARQRSLSGMQLCNTPLS